MEFDWQQPKNNKIFEQLTADSLKPEGTFAMTLIQDGNQIESKMVQTGILDTYIPKEWAEANGTTPDAVDGYLALQLQNKVFEYNCTGDKVYDNCWDFVGEGVHALFMDIDSEVVGKNFLYKLTEDKYAAMLKDAFNALPADEQAYFQPTIDEMESEANDLGLGADGKYALAWIKLWVGSYNAQTDDGPICNTLVSDSATDQCGLLVYSKLRSVEESCQTFRPDNNSFITDIQRICLRRTVFLRQIKHDAILPFYTGHLLQLQLKGKRTADRLNPQFSDLSGSRSDIDNCPGSEHKSRFTRFLHRQRFGNHTVFCGLQIEQSTQASPDNQ